MPLPSRHVCSISVQFLNIVAILFAVEVDFIRDLGPRDVCASTSTDVVGIPSWLHVRTRLGVAVWGDHPLRPAEAAALRLLGGAARWCPIGSIAVRLAAVELDLRLQLSTGTTAPPGAVNVTALDREWHRLRAIGFNRVVLSGWPAFEYLWQIQQHLQELGVVESLQQADDCHGDTWMKHAWDFLGSKDAFDAKMLAQVGRLAFNLKDMHRSSCPMATVSFYLAAAIATFRKPHVRDVYLDGTLCDVPKDVSYRYGVDYRYFLRGAQQHPSMHDLWQLFASEWPILPLLASLAGEYMLTSRVTAFITPYVANIGAQEGHRIAMVECGAHDGHGTREYASLLPPDVEIWAFEANPSLAEAFRKMLVKCGAECVNVSLVTCALGNEDLDNVEFYANLERSKDETWGTDSSSSLLKPVEDDNPYLQFRREPLRVPLRRLDTVAPQLGRGAVRFLELDAQGADLDIVRGAGRLLKGVNLIQMEILAAHYEGAPSYDEIKASMDSLGFVVLARNMGDALFVRRDLALL